MGLLKWFRGGDKSTQPTAAYKVVAVVPKAQIKLPDPELRPQLLSDFTGQPIVTTQLQIAITAAKMRAEPLRHVLAYGPKGLGKTTCAHIIANEMGSKIHTIAGPTLTSPKSLMEIVTDIKANDVLFIDEIHRIHIPVEETLYSIMEDFKMDYKERHGSITYIYNNDIPKFTLVGATTRLGDISAPMRTRFGLICEFQLYNENELTKIVIRSAGVFKIGITDESALMVAQRSRGTPRVANRLVQICRDYAQVTRQEVITKEIVEKSLKIEGVDERGLTRMDYRYLKALVKNGGMAGVESLSANINEPIQTIEDVIEPHLLREGYIQRTRTGRKVTDSAKRLLKAEDDNKFRLSMP